MKTPRRIPLSSHLALLALCSAALASPAWGQDLQEAQASSDKVQSASTAQAGAQQDGDGQGSDQQKAELQKVDQQSSDQKSSAPKPSEQAKAEDNTEDKKTAPLQSLAVLDFSLSGDVAPDLARTLADVAAQQAALTQTFRVVSQRDVVAQIGLEQAKQLLGCDDASCYSEVADSLNTDFLLSGSVALVDDTTVFTMSLIDVRRAEPLRRTSERLPKATQAELLDASRRLAHESVTGEKFDTTGVVRIEVNQPGALVTINGQEIGTSPILEGQRLPDGVHTILVQKKGFVRWEGKVTVEPGASLPVRANLVPLATVDGSRSRAWTFGYVSAGIAVAALATGGVFGYLSNASHQQYSATTLRSEALQLRQKTEEQALIANIAYGVGGATALASGALFVTAVISDTSRSAKAEAGSASLQQQGLPAQESGDRFVGVSVAGRF